ncbi:short-chain dehydrogenase [Edaphobacter acidisoli]|uniref:Short-chain dehydrogenase n=1 Tax=Edaphobacter acidisoli TaxID=2040573 RepID=A0A916RGW6_9BACT|nr:SDR family NAD(P)-dependent oxidoreductase [Edaphobacter acidisoli]GGA56180.1 short-chain dehydrogenase [Edaphobacter acidisoli]
MSWNFKDQRVLVAGGTGGLGRAVSLAFLGEGARVFVTYRSDAEFAALKKDAGASAGLLQGYRVDVTDEAAVQAMVEKIVAGHGGVDALVNTVGGYAAGSPLWETEPEVLEKMLTLNLRVGHLLARAVVPVMLGQKSGAIVNVAARAAVDHAAGAFAYAASKAAAVAMMDSLAADLKGTGVRVNSVLPSIIDTEVNRKAMPQADFAKWPKPEEIASVILFLCSREGRVVDGAAVPVYGGQ